jgi:hypothetical protein
MRKRKQGKKRKQGNTPSTIACIKASQALNKKASLIRSH